MPPEAAVVPAAPEQREPERRAYCFYEIVQASAHPHVDMYKTLKHSLLPPRFLKRVTSWQRRFHRPASVLNLVALAFSCAVPLVGVSLGRAFAVCSFALQMPLLVLGFLSLRTDMILQLVATYEFWFFSFVNSANTAVLAWYLRDLRAVFLLAVWLGVQYTICIDAAIRGFHAILAALVCGVLFHSVTFVAVSFRMIPSCHSFVVFAFGARSANAETFLGNSIGTIIYMLSRSIYRKSAVFKTRSDDAHVVQCTSYRCPVRLRVVGAADADSTATLPQQPAGPQLPLLVPPASEKPRRRGTCQMLLAKPPHTFDSRKTLCGHSLSARRLPKWQRQVLSGMGALGLTLTVVMFLTMNYSAHYPLGVRILAATAAALSVSYCGVCVALYQPGLLRYLCLSFDFVFLSLQLTFAHLSACDVFQWDFRSMILLSSFCWTHLFLTVDAFTPVARRKIGFRLAYLAPVVFVSLLAHLMILYEMATDISTWRMRDRSMAKVRAFGYTLDVFVMPIFFNRVWMLLLWEARVLWRVLKATSCDLIIIHGAVVFDLRNAVLNERGHAAAPSAASTAAAAVTSTTEAVGAAAATAACGEVREPHV